MKVLMLIAVVGATGAATTLEAQGSAPKTDSTCTSYPGGRVECRVFRNKTGSDSGFERTFFKMDSAMANRAALGIQLRSTGTRRDTLGVFVEAVTPKGPAETAGIIEGDRIAAINGVDVRSAAADIEDPYTNGLASHRLSREVQKLTPGSRVTLRVYSGGRFRDVQVVAGKASDLMRLSNRFQMKIPGPGGMMEFGGPGPGAMMFRTPMPGGFRTMQPSKVRIRTPERLRQLSPERLPKVMKVEPGEVFDSNSDIWLDDDSEPLEEVFQFDNDFVTTDSIRELGAATVRDARAALKRLAAEGLVWAAA